MWLRRRHAGDIHVVMKLNAQYRFMERTAVAIRTQLLWVQTALRKHEKDVATCNQDARSEHITQQPMIDALAHAPSEPAATIPSPLRLCAHTTRRSLSHSQENETSTRLDSTPALFPRHATPSHSTGKRDMCGTRAPAGRATGSPSAAGP
jgi:hypothetical protein